MILRVKGFYIIVSPYVFLVVSILLLRNKLVDFILCIIALILHEMGHILVACALKEKIGILKILPFGFSCRFKNQSKISNKKMLKILIAGPAVNLITAGIFYFWTKDFAMTNFLLGIFNLLPIWELDGMRIFSIIFN